MPALNIRFTDAELAGLRSRAATEGRSMTAIAHDMIVESTARADHDAKVMGAAAHVIALSRDLLKRLADR
jgi:plasmid stability protein